MEPGPRAGDGRMRASSIRGPSSRLFPMSLLQRVLAVVLFSLALVRPASAVDYTDIWYNPAEAGWGVNLVQSNSFIFATFFIYGAGNKPYWVTAQLTRNSTTGEYTGPVYETTGTSFGDPWNNNSSTVTQVGTATFTPSSAIAGKLDYTINGTSVSKQIQRQALTAIPLGGKYSGAYLSIFSNCSNSANNGPLTFFANLTVTQTAGGPLKFEFDSNSAFSASGPYIQDGTLFRIPNATFTMNGKSYPGSFTEIKGTSQGIEGTWTANVSSIYAGCTESGYFSALFITP